MAGQVKRVKISARRPTANGQNVLTAAAKHRRALIGGVASEMRKKKKALS